MDQIGKLAPVDPAIRSWIAEARVPLDSPWMYLGTPERVISSAADVHRLDLAYHHPGTTGAYRSLLFLPQSQLQPEWAGYRLELLGIVHELDAGAFQVKPELSIGPPGPYLRILKKTGHVMLSLELWRQRCYRPSDPTGAGAPPLVAEIHWWPGSEKMQPTYRILAGHPDALRPDDIRQARRDWAVLNALKLTINLGGSPKGPRKGAVWSRRRCLEWWRAWTDLDREPTQAELAADMEVRDPETAVKRWRSTGLHWPPTTVELDELESS